MLVFSINSLLHLWRGLVVSVMAFLFFWGLARVPLAEAIGLSFIAPLIALYLAAVLLKEKFQCHARTIADARSRDKNAIAHSALLFCASSWSN